MQTRQLVIFGLLASLICALPAFFTAAAGDLLHQYAMIECYGSQLWTGHLYPRWCMNANAGYGSPIPMFYFPLPYYFASVFYPLRYVGIDIPAIYQFVVFLTHFLTFLGVYTWLKTSVQPRYATIGAALFLLLSYRMELIYFRAAYSELFCVAIIPWLLVIAKRWQASRRDVCQLGSFVALGLLSHPSVMAMGYVVSFFYMLVMSALSVRKIIYFGVAGVLAIAATSFHWATMHYFSPFLNETSGGTAWLQTVWVNSFANQASDSQIIHLHVIHIATLLVGLGLFAWISRKKPINKEMLFLACMAMMTTFMVYSISAPLWSLLEMIIQVKIPWRMFLFPSFFVVMVVAQNLQYRVSMVAAVALVGLGLCAIPPEKQAPQDAKELVIATQRILAFARPRWVDARYDSDDARFFYHQFVFNRPHANANLFTGGSVKITQWNSDGMIMLATHKQPDKLIIEHFYFPLWRAEVNGIPVPLRALGDGTGRMRLDVPSGESTIVIRQDVSSLPQIYQWISLLSAVILWVGMRARPRKTYV